MKKRNTAIIGAIGVVFFVLSVVLSGLQFQTYSHISQFISEAYAQGTPYGLYLRLFGYLPSGILFVLFGIRVSWHFRSFKTLQMACIGFSVFYGVGIIITSIFPCDQGCVTALSDSSVPQIIHNVFSALVYICVPWCLLVAGMKLKLKKQKGGVGSIILGILALFFVPMVLLFPDGPYVGLFQRIIEGSILGWVVLICYNLWRA